MKARLILVAAALAVVGGKLGVMVSIGWADGGW